MKNKCLDTIFRLLKSYEDIDTLNGTMYLLPEVFLQRPEESISIFYQLINNEEIAPQVCSYIGSNLVKIVEKLSIINPEFVENIYKNYFGYIRINNSEHTITNKNYQYMKFFDDYLIVQSVKNYLKIRGIDGLKIIIGCINFYNYQNYIKKYSNPDIEEKTIDQTLNRVKGNSFIYENTEVFFFEDMTEIWDSIDYGFEGLIDILFKYIKENINEISSEVVQLFKSEKMVAQLWLRFIDLMLETPDRYLDTLSNLAVGQTSLKFSSTLYKKIGNIIDKIILMLDETQRKDLELDLLKLYTNEKSIPDWQTKQVKLRARRYIDLIGENLLLQSTRDIYLKDKSEGKEPHKILLEDTVKVDFESCISDYDTFRYGELEDSSIQKDFAKKIKQLREFYYNNLNDSPSNEAIKETIPIISEAEIIFRDHELEISEILKKDYMQNLSLAITKICSNIKDLSDKEKNLIKALIFQILETESDPKEDPIDADTMYYLNATNTKAQIAQALTLFLRQQNDENLYDKLINLAQNKTDSSIIYNILLGLFPKGKFFINTENNWNILNTLVMNIESNYYEYQEIQTATYYYSLYAACFDAEKSECIIKKLEEIDTQKNFLKHPIYNVLYYYFDEDYIRINWINERVKQTIKTYDPAVYKKILNLLSQNINQFLETITIIIDNILLEKNFLLNEKENKECLQLFINQLDYRDYNEETIKNCLPLLEKIITTTVAVKDSNELYNNIINHVLEIILKLNNIKNEEIKHILSIIISSLDKIPNSGIPQNDIYNIYKQKENIVLILEKINENTELQTIIKDTPNLFEYYCYIINKIALFSDNPKCMNFIWNLK